MPFRLPDSWAKSLENKQYFDEDLRQDSLDLLEASAALEITEFKLFELSYREWYGKQPLPHVVEAHFSDYMFNGAIPAWVRSYSRQIVDLHKSDRLDPREFGVYQPLPSKRLIRIGRTFAALLVVTFVVLMALITKEPPVTQSLFGRADIDRISHSAMP